MTYLTATKTKQGIQGFTIIELLIVISVIAILAAITIVSYSAITDNSRKQTARTDAQTIASQINKHKADTGAYPANLNSITNPSGVNSTFQYTYDAATSSYCVTASMRNASAYVRSGSLTTTDGACTGHTIGE